jgi:trans-aconitate 2-methyltransferase
MPTWDSNLYLTFADERTQPSIDLTARIPLESPKRIIDLGCGPGNSTAVLRQRWSEAEIVGLDNSPEMVAAASAKYPAETWLLADVAHWTAEIPFDLVFSNATLQWVPKHAELLPHLMAQVAGGGVLAVQMPTRNEAAMRTVVQDIAADPIWRDRFHDARRALIMHPPEFYYDVLSPLCSRLDIWETTYYHRMDSPQAVVNWFRGTGLRPYLDALTNENERQAFEQRVLDAYTELFPRRPDGLILFPFPRLFFIAVR